MTMDLTRLTNLAETLRERSDPARRVSLLSDRSWYRIQNLTEVTEVYLYDMIGEWGVTAQDFVGEFKALTGPVDLHINCEGGEVFDGIAIFEAIASHPAPVTAYVDSIAASAASFIVQAAGRRVMARNARMVIHDAQGLCAGNPADMLEMFTLLDDLSNNIADIYAERAGGTVASWRARMGTDTWYSAQTAVDAGLADEVASRDQGAPSASLQVDRSTPHDSARTPLSTWDASTFLRAVTGATA